MARKVNPNSFRLQLHKNWKSKWFSESDYTELLAEDILIRKFLDKYFDNRSAVARIEIERTNKNIVISVFTARPGVVIGKGGSGMEQLKSKLSKIIKGTFRINVEEVKRAELNAQLVALNMAGQLERRFPFRRVMKSTVESSIIAGAKGIKVSVSGRLNGADMARRETISEGSIPLQTIKSNVEYARASALTTYGMIGIKVWINKD